MRILSKLCLVISMLSVAVMALAGDLSGTYKGRMIVDRGQLHSEKLGEAAHKFMARYSDQQITLKLMNNKHFSIEMKKGTLISSAAGTYELTDGGLTLTALTEDGKKVAKPEPSPMTVSKNERELRLLVEGSNLIYIQFTKQ